jgi:hypothetical protein
MPRFEPRPLAALVVLDLAVVVGIAVHDHADSPLRVAVACVLGAVATASVLLAGTSLAGRRFGATSAALFAILPVAARHYFYGPFLDVYDHSLRVSLVGLHHTAWFALGAAVAALVALAPPRLTGAAGIVAAGAGAVVWGDGAWRALYGQFHETTWSPTLLCVLPVAGVIGAALRDPWRAAALGGWLAVFVLRGLHQPYGTGGFWLSLTAATPAAALLLTSLVSLVPPLRAPGTARVHAPAP